MILITQSTMIQDIMNFNIINTLEVCAYLKSALMSSMVLILLLTPKINYCKDPGKKPKLSTNNKTKELDMEKAVALRFEGGPIFRNVRDLDSLKEEFEMKNIAYAVIDKAKLRYATWRLVLVFRDKATLEMFQDGSLEYVPGWDASNIQQPQRINPLKAAKRAAKRK